MSSVNKAILIGHLGRDPEVRRLASGAPVVSLSLATSERWTDKASGEKRDRTEWHDVVIYNENICKVAEQYLRKGSKVYVEGQLHTREWDDSKTGQKRRRTEVVLQAYRGELALLDSKRESAPLDNPRESGGDYAAMKGGAATSRPAGGAAPRATSLDDDIPF